jgi:hypothetical protein
MNNDHPLGTRSKLGRPDGQWISGSRQRRGSLGRITSKQIRKGQSTNTPAHAAEQLATGGKQFLFKQGVHG